ncbi:MAG: hypothetical protein WD184_09915 [Acidimicrobiia bacterium]
MPVGHGHRYSPSAYIDFGITDPPGRTQADATRLKALFAAEETGD